MEEDSLSGSSDASSSSMGDLAPRIRSEFANLSSVLAETNQNIHSFEFMLTQYRQLATVPPTVSREEKAPKRDVLDASQLASSAKLQSLLSGLSEAVDQVAHLKDQLRMDEAHMVLSDASLLKEQTLVELRAENAALRGEVGAARAEVEALRQTHSVLERNLSDQSRLCEQLRDSAHRSRQALDEERDRSRKLDQKLDVEQKAAQKVGQDITRYVSHMQSLEQEILAMRRANNQSNRGEPVIDMRGDTLSVHYPHAQDDEDEVKRLSAQVEAEQALRQKAERENTAYEARLRESETQLADLKRGLETLENELEHYQSLAEAHPLAAEDKPTRPPTDRTVVEALRQQLTRKEQKAKNLKDTCDILLRKYRDKKSSHQAMKRRIKGFLLTLLESLGSAERNYRYILSHLGSEIEISARLMAAYLHITVKHQPVQLLNRSLSEWFNDIQALSTWLQKQILAFGQRYWTSKEPGIQPKTLIQFPSVPCAKGTANTCDDISEALSSRIAELPKDSRDINSLVREHEHAILDGSRLVCSLLEELSQT